MCIRDRLYFLLVTLNEVPFLNKSEATKRAEFGGLYHVQTKKGLDWGLIISMTTYSSSPTLIHVIP